MKKNASRKSYSIGATALRLEDVRTVAREGLTVTLSPSARNRVRKAREFLEKKARSGEVIYGVNTGFGLLSNVRIDDSKIETLQYNLLRSHATGIGSYLSIERTRAMLFLRAANLALGHSGVRVEVIDQLLALLNAGITPCVPEQGSVGASGDLAPLSHLALPLIGEGRVIHDGREMSARDALKRAGLAPIQLRAKEGLALINGTQFMTAIGVLELLEAEYLCDFADIVGGMTVDALKGTTAAFDADIHRVRPHPGQIHVAKRLREILAPGEKPSAIAKSHEDCGQVQDPYSLRCMPQVHGASRDTLRFVREVLEREVNSVTDNPLVFPASGKIISGGNFHGQIVAIAMDAMSIAMAEIASISEQRIEKLVNPAISGLPAFLARDGGLNSGFMIVQVAAASLVSENKTLAHPASVDSIPTSADKEDHVSMGAWAARKAGQIVTNCRRVLAMELLASSTGIEFHRPLKSSPAVERTISTLRERVKPVRDDRIFHEDLREIEDALLAREFSTQTKGARS